MNKAAILIETKKQVMYYKLKIKEELENRDPDEIERKRERRRKRKKRRFGLDDEDYFGGDYNYSDDDNLTDMMDDDEEGFTESDDL